MNKRARLFRSHKIHCVRRPGNERSSRWWSSVRRMASKIMEVAATMLSGSLSLVERRNSMAFFSISSFRGITARSLRKSNKPRSSLSCMCRFDSSSIRTITLVKNRASPTLIPSEGRSYCWSSNLMTAQVSKTMLVPFIADSPLIRNAVSAKDTLACSKEPRKRLAVRVGGFFFRHLQGFLKSAGIAAGQRSIVKSSFRRLFGGSRSKGENSVTCRYFARNVNDQPMAGRYLYGLRNGHSVNIA